MSPFKKDILRKRKGYTVMEVLIASLIFTMMVSLAVTSLEVGLRPYKRIMEGGLKTWEETRLLTLHKSLSSSLDYYVYDQGIKKWFPLFLGQEDFFLYTTLSPLTHDQPVLAILKREVNSEGKYALLYYELPLHTLTFADAKDILLKETYKKNNPLIILNNLDRLNFHFLVYDERKREYIWAGQTPIPNLLPPALLKIEINEDGARDNLYAIIRVNSINKLGYEEKYPKRF